MAEAASWVSVSQRIAPMPKATPLLSDHGEAADRPSPEPSKYRTSESAVAAAAPARIAPQETPEREVSVASLPWTGTSVAELDE